MHEEVNTVMMKLAAATTTSEPPLPVSLLSGSLPAKAVRAAELGYRGLELLVLDPDRESAEKVKQELAACNLEVAALGTGAQLFTGKLSLIAADAAGERAAFARLEKLIRFAAACGTSLVTLGSFRGRLAWGGEGARRRLEDILRRAADQAAGQGVKIALEPLNRYETDWISTTAEGKELIRRLDHPALGLLLDTFHMNIEDPDIGAAVRLAGEDLFHVHLGDSNRLSPGQGHFDFAGFLQALRETGYRGWLSAELLALPDPDTAARRTAAAMRPLLLPAAGA
jgi:sugar phosphate isomerase/epimerase